MFLDEFPTLSETFLLNQIVGVIESGHELKIIARFRGKYDQIHNLVSEYHLNDRVLYMCPEPRGVMRRFWELCRLLLSHKGWWSRRGLEKFRSILGHVRNHQERIPLLDLVRLTSHTFDHRYDIIHCQYATLGLRALLLKKLGLISGELITSVRGHDITDKNRTRRGYSELFEHGSLFLPVSESLKTLLVAEGCPTEKIEVHHSGIRSENFEFRDRGYSGEAPLQVLTIGRHVPMKGLSFALQAIANVRARGISVEYHLIGDGPLRGELENLAERLEIREVVHFHGWQKQSYVLKMLQEADVFVSSSITLETGEAEGIPNAVKEAMAVGLPTIATRHSGIPELIEDDVSGYLVAEGDVEALSERIACLVERPDLAAGLGQNARETVVKYFDSQVLNRQLIDIYSRFIAV